jgi:hypothetical protein
MQFTISARGKRAGQPIQQFIKQNFGSIPLEQIDSFFGFTTYSSLYGGRIWHAMELSEYDVRTFLSSKSTTVPATPSSSPTTTWLPGSGRIFPSTGSRPA